MRRRLILRFSLCRQTAKPPCEEPSNPLLTSAPIALSLRDTQVLADGHAIVNGRITGSWRKVSLATGRTLWTCGGAHGNFTIVDRTTGRTWAPGAPYWNARLLVVM